MPFHHLSILWHYFSSLEIRHRIYILTILVFMTSAAIVSSCRYLFHNYIFPTEELWVKAVEANMVRWLSAKQGDFECSLLFPTDIPPGLVWTPRNTLLTKFMPARLPKRQQWVVKDRLDDALDRLRVHQDVTSMRRSDGEVYFATELSKYTFRCKIKKTL